MSIRKSRFGNGFDHNFVFWGMEDQEYAYRAFRRGVEIFMIKEPLCYHQWHPLESVSEARSFATHKIQSTLFYKKHLSKARLHRFGAFIFLDAKPPHLEIMHLRIMGRIFRYSQDFQFSKADWYYFVDRCHELRNNLSEKTLEFLRNPKAVISALNKGIIREYI